MVFSTITSQPEKMVGFPKTTALPLPKILVIHVKGSCWQWLSYQNGRKIY
ncbi:hypothetical protein SB48_HM08orf05479 [Heyndrickxia coagulans]|uniref:Uncharacterized protein n=1 Tax=Heyndrickxia coagulans TaxID=1398 RepID=A0AAN0TAH4_HEYCO|nr:hypothetical protein SB48_HM08orf05479 [Heyndrickxia coagulans]